MNKNSSIVYGLSLSVSLSLSAFILFQNNSFGGVDKPSVSEKPSSESKTIRKALPKIANGYSAPSSREMREQGLEMKREYHASLGKKELLFDSEKLKFSGEKSSIWSQPNGAIEIIKTSENRTTIRIYMENYWKKTTGTSKPSYHEFLDQPIDKKEYTLHDHLESAFRKAGVQGDFPAKGRQAVLRSRKSLTSNGKITLSFKLNRENKDAIAKSLEVFLTSLKGYFSEQSLKEFRQVLPIFNSIPQTEKDKTTDLKSIVEYLQKNSALKTSLVSAPQQATVKTKNLSAAPVSEASEAPSTSISAIRAR